MNHDCIERVLALSNAFGPSGMEDEVVALAKADTADFCDAAEDTLRNLYLRPRSNASKPGGCTITLDAHSDEVGFMVQALLENGTLRFLPLGGWNPVNIVGAPVKIQTQNGFVTGIVAAKPVHFMSEEEKRRPIDFDSLVIDVGTSDKAQTRALGIRPGDFVVPAVSCAFDENRGVFMGKAFDCRIGCAALLDTLRQTQTSPNHVIGVLSAQEEVGDRGSTLAAKKIQADVVICFEGCPADDSFESPDLIQSAMNKGVMLRAFDRSMITHPRFQRFALRCAEEHGIPYQVAVRKGGGTNGGIYHTYDMPTIVIGIPTRFAHSSVGFCSIKDYEGAVELAKAIIESLDKETVASF